MRIVDESGKWDLLYEQVSLRLDKNKLYAYPLFSNVCDKPIFLKAFPDEKTGMECLMSIRYAWRCDAGIYNLSKRQFEEELEFYSAQNNKRK